MPDDKVRIVLRRRTQDRNLTIVGDWFVAESQALRQGEGYRQTVFSWHAPTVLRELRKFDQEFEEFPRQSGLDPADSRRAAIAKIQDVITGLAENEKA